MKRCSKCHREFAVDAFPFKDNSFDKRGKRCADCKNSKAARWVKNNPEKAYKAARRFIEAGKARKHRLKKQYGLTEDQFNSILHEQGGVCAICKRQSDKKLAVDHNHKTMKMRGLLCASCNRGIGYFKENVESLTSAIEYIRLHS